MVTFFKPTKQLPKDTWASAAFRGNTGKKDKYDNIVYLIKIDGAEMEWGVNPASKSATKLDEMEVNQVFAIKWFQGDKYPAVVIDDPEDAKVLAEVATQTKRAPIAEPASNDDIQERITMGMCMNCASRVVAEQDCDDWTSTAIDIVNLAKAIYTEYTKEEESDEGREVPKLQQTEEVSIDDLPF